MSPDIATAVIVLLLVGISTLIYLVSCCCKIVRRNHPSEILETHPQSTLLQQVEQYIDVDGTMWPTRRREYEKMQSIKEKEEKVKGRIQEIEMEVENRKALESELERSKAAAAQLISDIEECRARAESNQAQSDSLDRLAVEASKVAPLQDRIARLKSEINELKKQLEIKLKKIEQLYENQDSLVERRDMDAPRYARLEKETLRLRGDLENTQSALSRCRVECANSRQELKDAHDGISALQKEFGNALSAKEQIEIQCKHIQRRIESSEQQQQIAVLQAKIEDLTKKVNNDKILYQGKIEDLEGKYSLKVIQNTSSNLELQLQELRTENSFLQDEANDLKQAMEKKDLEHLEAIKGLEANHQDFELQHRTQVQQFKSAISEKDTQIELHLQEKRHIECRHRESESPNPAEIDDLKSNILDRQTVIDGQLQMIEGLGLAMAEKESTIQNLEFQLKSLDSRDQLQVQENERLLSEGTALQTRYQDLQTAQSALRQQAKERADEILALRAEVEKFKTGGVSQDEPVSIEDQHMQDDSVGDQPAPSTDAMEECAKEVQPEATTKDDSVPIFRVSDLAIRPIDVAEHMRNWQHPQ
jgi:chromosome segregation ATPase